VSESLERLCLIPSSVHFHLKRYTIHSMFTFSNAQDYELINATRNRIMKIAVTTDDTIFTALFSFSVKL